jgi:hypothetical protein
MEICDKKEGKEEEKKTSKAKWLWMVLLSSVGCAL